jgi:hypothetical protein
MSNDNQGHPGFDNRNSRFLIWHVVSGEVLHQGTGAVTFAAQYDKAHPGASDAIGVDCHAFSDEEWVIALGSPHYRLGMVRGLALALEVATKARELMKAEDAPIIEKP